MEGVESLSQYVADHKTRSAVERQLAIIGEAVNHIQRSEPGLHIEGSRSIVGMRNRLIHSYDNVDNKIVWLTLRSDLPVLMEQATRHLNG